MSSDTSFFHDADGILEASTTRRYRQEGIIDTRGVLLPRDSTAPPESNTAIVLENVGSHTIRNPQIELNGQRMMYRFADLVDRIDLTGLSSVDDTIQAVWAFLNDNYYPWLVSTDANAFTIRPLRTFNVYGSGFCENSAQVMASILQFLGYGAGVRIIGGGRHTVGTVVVPDGREILFDPNMKVLYKDRRNFRLAGFNDLVEDQALARRQHHLGYAAREQLHDPTIALFYSNLLSNATKSWTAIDSCPLVLRSGEKIVFPFRQSPGEDYAFYHHVRSYNATPPPPPPTASIGAQAYVPPLGHLWEELIDRENVTLDDGPHGPILRHVTPGLPARITTRFSNPFAITQARALVRFAGVDSTDTLRVHFRKEGDLLPVIACEVSGLDSATSTLDIDLTPFIQPVGTPTTNVFYVTVEWTTTPSSVFSLDSLAISASFQFNPNALPRLRSGVNAIRIYATEGAPLGGLRYTHVYRSTTLDGVPPQVTSSLFPADGGLVESTTPEFRWLPPSAMPEVEIADYHIQISERPDFRFPVSSACDKLVTQTGRGVEARWTLPEAGLLNPGTTYYWRVAAVSHKRLFGPWSPTWSFVAGGPSTPENLQVKDAGDTLWLEWNHGSSAVPGSSFEVLASDIRGFGLSDDPHKDTVTAPRFMLKGGAHMPRFTFYRVIVLAPDGRRSGMSEQLSLESYRLFAVPPEVATVGDSVRIAVKAMETIERELISHSIYELPAPRVDDHVDSVEFVGSTPSALLETNRDYVTVKIGQRADSSVVLIGRMSYSQNPCTTSVAFRMNSRPQFVDLLPVEALEDSVVTMNVSAEDPDGDPLMIRAAALPSWMHFDTLAGRLYGTPGGTHVGNTSLTLRAIDCWGAVAEEQVLLHVTHVNHSPHFMVFPCGFAAEDSAYASRIVAVDEDSALFGDRLVYRLQGNPAWMRVDTSTGVITGTPAAMDVGRCSVMVSVDDGRGGFAAEAFDVTVLHTNHAPEVFGPAVVEATEDSVVGIALTAGDRDSLRFGDRITFLSVLKPAWCSLDTLRGILSGIPRLTDLGDTLLHISVVDGKGGETPYTTVFRIRHVNHAPTFTPVAAVSVGEDDSVVIEFTVNDPDTLIGDRLTPETISIPSWLRLDWPNRRWYGVPAAHNVGDTLVYIRVTDEAGGMAHLTAGITVHHRNHSPVISGDPQLLAVEDSLYRYLVRARDPDSARFGDRVRFRLERHPRWLQIDSATGLLSGIPRMADVGRAEVVVTAVDDSAAIARLAFTVTVWHVNHPPVFVETARKASQAVEDILYSEPFQAVDPDSLLQTESLRYTLGYGPHWLSVDSTTGVVSGTPGEGDKDSVFVVMVTDGLMSDTVCQSISVQSVNDAPALTVLPHVDITEDDSVFVPFADWYSSVTDPDDDSANLRWSAVSTAHVRTLCTEEGMSFVPQRDFHGTDTLTVTATDPQGLSASVALVVRVSPVNDPVVLTRMENEATAFADILFALPVQSHDPDGPDSLVRYCVTGPEWLRIGPDGMLTGLPRTLGLYSATVYAIDGEEGIDSIHVTVRVRPTDEAKDLANSLPADFVLKQNYPNPFNPSTTIRYGLPVTSTVTLTVYNLLGQRLAVLREGLEEAGYREVTWDARGLSSGMYILEIRARSMEEKPRDYRAVKRLLLQK